MSRHPIFVVAAILSLSSGSALADKAKGKGSDKAKAKALYDEGLRHYNVAEYDEAIKVWKEAYLISKKPLLLFNIGQAYRLENDCTQAITFYDRYRGEGASAENLNDLEEAENLCKAKLAEKPVVAPAPPAPSGAAPAPAPPPPAVHDAPARGTTGMRKAGIAVGVAGVVLGGTAVYFALDASSKNDQLDHYIGEWGAKQVDLNAAGSRSEKLAWGLGVTAIGAIGAGVALYVLGGAPAESSSVAIVPTRGGMHVGWTTSF